MPAIWRFVTEFGDSAIAVPLAAWIAVCLLAAKHYRLALGWSVAIAGCAGTIAVLKLLLLPCTQPLTGTGLSSPSGHAAMSTAVYGGLVLIAGAGLRPSLRYTLIAAAAVLIIAIAASRAVLGVHSLAEVAIGLCVGLTTLAGIAAILGRYRPERLPVVWFACGVLLMALLFHGHRWPTEQAIHRLAGLLAFLRPWCS